MAASSRVNGSDRRFVLASAVRPEDARRTAAELPEPIDLVVTSPTELAQQAAASAVGNRWVFTLEEPLLAPRASGESGGDVLARFAQALRGVRARESRVSLVMCDTLDLLGGSTFVLDEKGLVHVADALISCRCWSDGSLPLGPAARRQRPPGGFSALRALED